MDVKGIAHYWDNDRRAMARDCNVSRATIYSWGAAGVIPELQAIKIRHEIIPMVMRRKELLEEVKNKLKIEAERGIYGADR